MATKKKFKEAEFVDQNETQAQAVPATDQEVAQAAPVEAAPVEDAPAEEEAVLPEGTDEGGVEVNPETVSVEVQIPTDQLSSAVAQATGDLEVANLSPDVESAQEAELVASEGPAEDVPVEGAVEEGNEDSGAETAEPQLESKKSDGNKLTEEEENPHFENGEAVAEERCEEYADMIDHSVEISDEVLQESENPVEDKVISEDPAEVIGDADDELPPGMDGEIEGDVDPALLDDGDGEVEGYHEFDVAIDEDDPAVQDFLSRIDDYLADEEAQPAQVADALRASADFFDAIAPEEEEADEDLLDVEEEDDDEIPFDWDAISNYKGSSVPAKTGDEVLDQFAELPTDEEEDDDLEESIERVPCKFPKKINESRRTERPLVKEKKLNEAKVYYDFPGDYRPWSGAVDTWDTIERADKIDDLEALIDECYPDGIGETELNDLLWFDSDWVLESLGISEEEEEDDDFEDEEEEEDLEESRREARKTRRMGESADYSSVKFPAGSGEDDEDIVSVYERTQASRRKAIKNFRESVIRDNENRSARQSRGSRFNEALRTSVRTNSRGERSNANSWANNRFIDRYNESQDLDFKALIRDGFLG